MGQRPLYLHKGAYTQNNMPSLRTNHRRLAITYINIDSYLTIRLLISQELQRPQLSLIQRANFKRSQIEWERLVTRGRIGRRVIRFHN